jgi:hypothetical protein
MKDPNFKSLTLLVGLVWASAAQAAPKALMPEAGIDSKSAAYRVLSQTALPGDGGWDFLSVDPEGRRLYVTHANSVQVLDADNLALLGTVAPVMHPHGVVILPALGRGYASSGEPGSVVVFDLKTFKIVGEVPASKDCDVIIHEPKSGNIFTFNGDSGNSTVIDPTTLKVLKTLDLGGAPEVAVADGKGIIYNNLEDKDQVLKIDAKTGKVLQRWSSAPGKKPTGLSLDSQHGRLFIGCRNKLLVVMDSASGKVLQSLPIGDHVDSTVYEPKTGEVFNSCGDGTLSVVHQDSPDSYKLVENVKTEGGAKTMALDTKTGHLFTATGTYVAVTATGEAEPRWVTVPGSFHVLMLGR